MRLSFLLGEACRSAPQTSGSAHLQAASPGSPTSCSILEAHFSLPFPSLPKPASCLLWQREPHTVSKKHKGKMRTPRAAEPGLIVLALELTVLRVRETANQDSGFDLNFVFSAYLILGKWFYLFVPVYSSVK